MIAWHARTTFHWSQEVFIRSDGFSNSGFHFLIRHVQPHQNQWLSWPLALPGKSFAREGRLVCCRRCTLIRAFAKYAASHVSVHIEDSSQRGYCFKIWSFSFQYHYFQTYQYHWNKRIQGYVDVPGYTGIVPRGTDIQLYESVTVIQETWQ